MAFDGQQVSEYGDVRVYGNPLLVARLQQTLGLSAGMADRLFQDTKLFLFAASISRKSISPPPMIDAGWHEFLMFTKDYREFCHKYLGKFIDHVPMEPGSGDPDKLRQAILLAKNISGQLTENWSASSTDCETCSPDTNCETPPSDCGTNHCSSGDD